LGKPQSLQRYFIFGWDGVPSTDAEEFWEESYSFLVLLEGVPDVDEEPWLLGVPLLGDPGDGDEELLIPVVLDDPSCAADADDGTSLASTLILSLSLLPIDLGEDDEFLSEISAEGGEVGCILSGASGSSLMSLSFPSSPMTSSYLTPPSSTGGLSSFSQLK